MDRDALADGFPPCSYMAFEDGTEAIVCHVGTDLGVKRRLDRVAGATSEPAPRSETGT